MKKLCLLLMVVLLILCSACSNSSVQNTVKELGDTVSSAADANNKYVLMVKNGYRENNPNLTYDKAFSAFFGTPRWKYFKGNDKQDVVEFTGDCTYQDTPVKARIQFVVDEKNGTFKAEYLAFNEVPQNMLILGTLIEKAFTIAPEQASAKMPDKNNNSTVNASRSNTKEASSGKNTSTEKSAGPATRANARNLVNAWLATHPFHLSTHIDPNTPNYPDEGRDFYYFILLDGGDGWIIDILVSTQTGQLYANDGKRTVPIAEWYRNYKPPKDGPDGR